MDLLPLQEWASDNAHLYLWVTNPKLPMAFDMMRQWGFTYCTMLTWIKTRSGTKGIVMPHNPSLPELLKLCLQVVHKGGLGFYYRGATEHVLLGVRGRLTIPSEAREPNVLFAPKGRHSAKPDAFYDLVDRVTHATKPDAKKIDIFARCPRPGWHTWGNEMGSGIQPPHPGRDHAAGPSEVKGWHV